MKKLIFKKFTIDVVKTFIIMLFSISLIVWVIQAVKYLDFVAEDGHSFRVYFSYTSLILPKIIHRIIPFVFFISLFYQVAQYEVKNELLILWTNGVNKISLINSIIIYSLMITLLQLFLGMFVSPLSQDKARDFIRDSNIDFFPSLLKSGKFIDTVSDLTIFIDSQDNSGNYENIFLRDSLSDNNEIKYQIIYAKKGKLINENRNRYFQLFNGRIINNNNGDITNFTFERIDFNLEKYTSKSTIFPKVQEVNILELTKCINSIYNDKIAKYESKNLRCNSEMISEVNQEFLKRSYKPLYIPLLALIISLLIIKSKEDKNYPNYKFIIFLIGFTVIIISEFSLRFSSKDLFGFLFFTLFPILSFFTTYIFLLTKFRNKA
jgi:lipopolysaccharide export system permease protein